MIELEKRITERQSVIRSLQDSMASENRAIGTAILESPPEDLGAELSDIRSRILDIQESAAGYSSLIERIHQITARRAEIQEEKNTLQAEIRTIDKDRENFYESIGEAAYEAAQQDPSHAQDFQQLFDEMQAAREEIESLRHQVNEAEDELTKKRFFDKVVVRGRLALLRGKLTNKEGSLPRLFFRLGQRVAESTFAREVASTDLDEALEPYKKSSLRVQELNEEIQALQNEARGLETELEEAGAGKRPGRRISELEQLTQDCERERKTLLEQLGDQSRSTVSEASLPKAAADAAHRVSELEKQIEAENAHIERLKAGIEALRIMEEIGQVERDVAAKNEAIKELKASVSELKKRKTELESMRDEALQRRGPEEDL
ncbi:MAG: hypothetical protein ACOC4I_07135 [Spirochaetota bacterium]